MRKFYLYFSACFGTFWLILLTVALITHRRQDAGEKGLIAALLISLVYGIYKAGRK